MRSGGLRRRMASLADAEHLSQAEADLILDPQVSKTVNEEVAWTTTDCPAEARFSVTVFNSTGATLTLRGRLLLDRPWRSHWLLTWGDKGDKQAVAVLRRLDLRDLHRNPDGETWEEETHKHRWSEVDGNSWAYTPTDIPHTPHVDPDTPDDYRSVFEAFAAECGISLGPDYKWSDPDLTPGSTPPLWEVP